MWCQRKEYWQIQLVKAVKNWPQPRNIHEVRSFIGLCTYYRRFVPGFSILAKPLHLLTEKNAVFQWTEQM